MKPMKQAAQTTPGGIWMTFFCRLGSDHFKIPIFTSNSQLVKLIP
jgi:hypothetical protein